MELIKRNNQSNKQNCHMILLYDFQGRQSEESILAHSWDACTHLCCYGIQNGQRMGSALLFIERMHSKRGACAHSEAVFGLIEGGTQVLYRKCIQLEITVLSQTSQIQEEKHSMCLSRMWYLDLKKGKRRQLKKYYL